MRMDRAMTAPWTAPPPAGAQRIARVRRATYPPVVTYLSNVYLIQMIDAPL